MTFGITRDMLGGAALELELPQGANVSDLQRLLHDRFPVLNRLASLLIAVNETYAAPELILQENDEIALIPPVSGG